MESQISFRLLQEEDVPFGMKLKRIAGWNQLPEDWRRFLELEPQGCFVAHLEDDPATPVGTVTTTSYGLRFGWVGMVLVPPEQRRHGIGSALLLHAIRHLESKGVQCVRLDATPLGKKLYDTLGFQDEYELERVQGWGKAFSSPGIEPMSVSDVAEVVEYDEPRFGAPRHRMLEMLHRQSPHLCFVATNPSGRLSGYLMARPGENAFQIGPWTADDAATAESLLQAGLNALAGQPVFLDILSANPMAPQLVKRYGFSVQRPFIRMFRGRHLYPGQPSSVHAICGVETG